MKMFNLCSASRMTALRLVRSCYLRVFGDERRLGIRLRRAGGLMGREEGKIASHYVFFTRGLTTLDITCNFFNRQPSCTFALNALRHNNLGAQVFMRQREACLR